MEYDIPVHDKGLINKISPCCTNDNLLYLWLYGAVFQSYCCAPAGALGTSTAITTGCSRG